MGMVEQVLHPYNLQRALRQVIVNKGSAGVDGMKVSELSEYFRNEKEIIIGSIKDENYLPEAILGVEIPKGNGKTRLLGVPTVKDRLLQQAVSQVLMQYWERDFNENSFGFRPNKNARQAVGKALQYIHEGKTYIVDIDLKTFFDEVIGTLYKNRLSPELLNPRFEEFIGSVLKSVEAKQDPLTLAQKYQIVEEAEEAVIVAVHSPRHA